MVRLGLLVLLAMVAGLMLAIDIIEDPGYILVAYGGYRFETSLFALLVAMLLLWTVLRMLLTVFGWLNPRNWRRRS